MKKNKDSYDEWKVLLRAKLIEIFLLKLTEWNQIFTFSIYLLHSSGGESMF